MKDQVPQEIEYLDVRKPAEGHGESHLATTKTLILEFGRVVQYSASKHQSPRRLARLLIIGPRPKQELLIKFTRETSEANLVSAWETGAVRIGEEWVRNNLILSAKEVLHNWVASDPENLEITELEPALALNPDVIIVGTGASLILPKIDLMTEIAVHGIGLEIMDTPAACRTYNVLVYEQRAVVAALFLS